MVYSTDQSKRAGISFPFVDRLSDNSTPFAYGNYILISGSNVLAVEGTELYGNTVVNGTFDPPCDAYAYVPGCNDGSVYFKAYGNLDQVEGKPPSISVDFTPLSHGETSPYSLDL